MDTRPLNLEGLPEPIARGLEVVAEMARRMVRSREQAVGAAPELPVWALGVTGIITREDIYGDNDFRV